MPHLDTPSRQPFCETDRRPPDSAAPAPAWERKLDRWRIRFLGRGPDSIAGLAAAVPPASGALAWLDQRHGARVALAAPGNCGAADALSIRTAGIVGAVSTADCVPIAVVRGVEGVLVHAGWRGLAARLPLLAAAPLCGAERGGETTAWIGPCIGPCCYRVGTEVAAAVRAACSGATEILHGDRDSPRLDLRWAAALQLRAAGVGRVHLLDHCTSCRGDWLWSHRRHGEGAGRNFALLWRDEDGARETDRAGGESGR